MKLLGLIFLSHFAQAACPAWTNAKKVGDLDVAILKEASGVRYSDQFGEKLYHINDSGNDPSVVVTNLAGVVEQKFRVTGIKAKDIEEIELGRCPMGQAAKQCVFLADIGNNNKNRKKIFIHIVEEKSSYQKNEATALGSVALEYPGKSEDAESFALHPNGDFYLLTKDFSRKKGISLKPTLYRIPYAVWSNAIGKKSKAVPLQKLASLDLEALVGKDGFLNRVPTSMDIASDGKSFIVLSYQNAIEFLFDLDKASTEKFETPGLMKKDVDFRVLTLIQLPQQEAITYVGQDRGIIYTSEVISGKVSEMMGLDCKK